jgi:hypothetical protein
VAERQELAGPGIMEKADERVPVVTRGGVDGQKRRFGDREEVIVLEEDPDVGRDG